MDNNPPPKRRRKKNTLSAQFLKIQEVKGTTSKWMKSQSKSYRTSNHTEQPYTKQVSCHNDDGPLLNSPLSHFHENQVVRYRCSFCQNEIHEVMTLNYNPTLPKPYVMQCHNCVVHNRSNIT